eukprot:gene36854-48069_t
MWMATALSLCPELKVLNYDFPLYQQISEQIYTIFLTSAPMVQPVSVDEAYLEYPRGSDPISKMTELRRRIVQETGCPASAGSGPNMLMARLATKKAKPNGQRHICSEQVNEVMAQLLVKDLPGVGHQMQQKLDEKNLKLCSDLWAVNRNHLREWFGEATGDYLFHASRGVDDRALQPPAPQKSIGAEVNWGLRFHKMAAAEDFVLQLAVEVHKRLSEAGLKGKTVTMKLKKRSEGENKEPIKFLGCGRCDSLSKSTSFQNATMTSSEAIGSAALTLFRSMMLMSGSGSGSGSASPIPVDDLRGMGIQISRLEDASQCVSDHSSYTSKNVSISSIFMPQRSKIDRCEDKKESNHKKKKDHRSSVERLCDEFEDEQDMMDGDDDDGHGDDDNGRNDGGHDSIGHSLSSHSTGVQMNLTTGSHNPNNINATSSSSFNDHMEGNALDEGGNRRVFQFPSSSSPVPVPKVPSSSRTATMSHKIPDPMPSRSSPDASSRTHTVTTTAIAAAATTVANHR